MGQPLSVMRRILSSGERLVFPRRKTGAPVPFRINGVSKFAVICWKHGDDRTHLMVVGCVFDLVANRKLRHRKLLPESSVRLYRQKAVYVSLTRLLRNFGGRLLLLCRDLRSWNAVPPWEPSITGQRPHHLSPENQAGPFRFTSG